MISNTRAAGSLDLLRMMLTIRKAEERLASDFKAGLLPGPVHLYIGQEAVATGICAELDDRDWITSTHRGHGHFLAKGGDPKAMFAEIYGRSTGICGGFGGSMHVADVSKGILGANGIVGGGVALATGAALAAQLDGENRVGVCFFGDGAAAQGVLGEALNVAALWKLPLILVCENNGFSEFSPSSNVIAGDIYRRAEPYGVPSVQVDGNDLDAVLEASEAALDRARNGRGGTLIEALTYRIHGHVEGEQAFLKTRYREDDEIERWRAEDPIERYARRLVDKGEMASGKFAELEEDIGRMIKDAADSVADDPYPEIGNLERHRLGAV
ncbi:thiamine pyrophosphate-dependent dehydrogenase E1 component subunit alpha [Hoeflea sp. WL0058]|uniref:Thiamine pyrophosphate-dependent dehydrogenase E1 component subunit alpha n=1 Tax=Flavimaribacter sediminis TaxID=2865987 RepID=A0AAE2ZKW3_9HYPH|nr:thiamine pyrophosphate-dependent dehydrogenase E1 component subunit alpha [Flavimaribacter sediminis]MBW8636148.1 thiamine pyrophosphate-dependent dehydrogenase E1 component subunit alpha [Flavimaribacter sediminis]